MSQLSEKVLAGLKKAYTTYFDIEEISDGTALKARCAYHNRDSQYVLVKKAELCGCLGLTCGPSCMSATYVQGGLGPAHVCPLVGGSDPKSSNGPG